MKLSPQSIVAGITVVLLLLISGFLAWFDMEQNGMFSLKSMFWKELPQEGLLEDTSSNELRASEDDENSMVAMNSESSENDSENVPNEGELTSEESDGSNGIQVNREPLVVETNPVELAEDILNTVETEDTEYSPTQDQQWIESIFTEVGYDDINISLRDEQPENFLGQFTIENPPKFFVVTLEVDGKSATVEVASGVSQNWEYESLLSVLKEQAEGTRLQIVELENPYGDAFAYINDPDDRSRVRGIMKKAGNLYVFSYNRSEHALFFTILQAF